MTRVCVMGAGSDAMATAAHLANEGRRVTLLARPGDLSPDLIRSKTLTVTGEITARVALEDVTVNPAEALPGREILILAAPAATHEAYARLMEPLVEDGQLILVNTGSTGAALHLFKLLEITSCSVPISIGETGSRCYVARQDGPAEVHLQLMPQAATFAAMPAAETPRALELARRVYPGSVRAESALETSLSNLRAIASPPGLLLNAGWIERTGGPDSLFPEGTTPAVTDVILAADEERMQLLRTLGLGAVGFLDQVMTTSQGGGSDGQERSSFYEAFRESEPLWSIADRRGSGDDSLTEDIGYGLVPMSEVGRLLGVHTPVIDSLITLGSIVAGKHYRTAGLTAEKMGLPRNVWQLGPYVKSGRRRSPV
ncbi:MAG TPA: NAD/NADP octopine/nopaline dehydrogenase family protein [Bacillota bacterium]